MMAEDLEKGPDFELRRHALNGTLPRSVAIVAMGPSCTNYLLSAVNKWDRHKLADEIWAVNAQGGVLAHDRLFMMDDLAIQRARAEANPGGGVDTMMTWLSDHPVPVYTSRAYPDFPGAVEYPLEWVINQAGHVYFNNTVPYAVAFAVALHVAGGEGVVDELHVYGCDYSYDGDAHKRERGRACLEYWLAVAACHGIRLVLPENTSLLDMNQEDGMYGYDTEDLTIEWTDEGGFRVTRADKPKEKIPTALAMEARYSHDVRVEQALKNKELELCPG